jgi:hypothetical protein
MKSDRQATEARNFKNPKSYVAPDGREVLRGEDWKDRKLELWERCSGRCEFHYMDGNRCSQEGQIPAHVIPRHPKRDDRLSNLMCYCIPHDRLTEKQSWRRTRWGEKVSA